MASDSRIHRGDRRAILKGVYEENVRVRDRSPRPPVPTSDPAPPRQANGKFLVVLLGLFFVAAGVVAQLSEENHDAASAVRSSSAAVTDSVPSIVPSNVPHSMPSTMPLLSSASAIPALRSTASSPPPASLSEQYGVSTLPMGRPSVADLYGLQLKTIVIDAGHGGRDPGAIGKQGLTEKEVTLDVALRLKARLEKYPEYRVLLTRDRDATMTLRERIDFANRLGADLFVSLHINWIPDETIAPIETFYYGPNSDARIVRMARRENKNSGFSHADFDEMTRQLGVELKIEESTRVARSIQEGLYRNMRRLNGEVSDWGAKSGDFMVLLGVRAPSVLAEIGSISNGVVESKLRTPSYRENLAFFLEEGLVNYLRQHAHEDERAEHAGQENEEGV